MYKIIFILKDWRNEIKWAYQRVVRGYDDTAYWDLAYYLASIINKVTFKLANEGSGNPPKTTEKEWRDILHQISFGFGSYIELVGGYYNFEDPEFKRLEKEFKKGLKLFCQYFEALWD